LRISCIYYGTEQCFDGNEGYHDYSIEPRRFAEDRYVREGMFGGTFGAFGTEGCHFFNTSHPTYKLISAMAALRESETSAGRALRGGKIYLRETSYCNFPFGPPPRGELIAWSRVLSYNEVIVAMNSNPSDERGAYITVDAKLHPPGSTLRVLYNNSWSDEEFASPPEERVAVEYMEDGRAVIRVDLPPAGMIVLH
ncbi:MAG: alpha-amylase, partial [Cyanobacteria bacterium]|nr:alpha-amylase [Cyanobacteriota bacterium]